ncbi:GNAT family N-acetyltransferase [Hamadaea tsunoensis]|uniref:GNAT family N-acetyltransferase n=1 Tax=Hamadaea tsunoensis TaxID=53368 RepID=UPI000480B93E|nr:GNAT family N-acetyltransferase [Hamadaea tsunoensis]
MSTYPAGGLTLEFLADPTAFLAAAGEHLAAEPVLSTVVTTVARRSVTRVEQGVPLPERDWWLVVRDARGTIVGAGMRTAPFVPYPMFLLPMPDEAAVGLARALHERGEETLGVNGALPAVRLCAAELARLDGGKVEVQVHTRLFELGDLVPPAPVPGELRQVRPDQVDLVQSWLEAFHHDADEQAGRPTDAASDEMPDRDETARRIESGNLWFWVDAAGVPVHVTGVTTPAFGVARIGPVYTPPAQRGNGWASAAVAEASRRLQADGVRACLFTDQANPTSNKIYTALGYRPVVDMANLRIAS